MVALASGVMSCGAMETSGVAAYEKAAQVEDYSEQIKVLKRTVEQILADKSTNLSRSLGRIVSDVWAITKGCASVTFVVTLVHQLCETSLTKLPGFWHASIAASLVAAYGLRA